LLRKIPCVENNLYFGRFVTQWVEIYYLCHNVGMGFTQWCWPDGKSLFEQPYYVIEIFSIINEQLTLFIQQKTKSKRK
jgi:hypothetical protein